MGDEIPVLVAEVCLGVKEELRHPTLATATLTMVNDGKPKSHGHHRSANMKHNFLHTIFAQNNVYPVDVITLLDPFHHSLTPLTAAKAY